jgi:hypothetical protein
MHIHKLGYVLVGISIVAACGSDSTKPTASGIFPADGFTGRTLRVEISGDATNWKDGATVSFGQGVTVNSVAVASPTDLFADISIDPAAPPGLVDVTVTSGGTYTLAQAFELKSPVAISFVGDLDQGGFPAFTIKNFDFSTPFDGTTDPSTGKFANLTITGPNGTGWIIGQVDAYSITGFASLDTDATAGTVSVMSGPAASAITSVTGNMAVMPRTPTPLASGTAGTGTLMNENDTQLYGLTAAGSPSLVHIKLTTTDMKANPFPSILPASGHWADQIGSSWAVAPSGGQVYIVVFDGGTESGYTFQITAFGETLTTGGEGNDTTNNVTTTAPAITTIPFMENPASISSATDKDYIKITVPAGGKRIHVTTTSGDPNTDTQIDVLGSNGTTSYTPPSAGGPGPGDGTQCGFFGCSSFGEDFVSNPVPAGTAYIKVEAGQDPNYGPGYDSQHASYNLIFWFE